MTPEFLAAIIDTLLPGDYALPSGTRAGLDPAAYAHSHRSVFDAIVAQAGGSHSFAGATEGKRVGILQAVERLHPDAFRVLVVVVLSDYYESSAVLTALRWRADPPQPVGHILPEIDKRMREQLERLTQRGRRWRG
jgi:hypothetical protein